LTVKKEQAAAILGTYDWNFQDAENALAPMGVKLCFVRSPPELQRLLDSRLEIDFAFAPHWRYLIEARFLCAWPVVGFHLGRLPDDRGGSPIQHQILRGAYATQLCAFRIDEGIDTGPVYFREDFDLSEGSLEYILRQASSASARIMVKIMSGNLAPTPQDRTGTIWQRRGPSESRIPDGLGARSLYDFIRMLDCPGYPHAFSEVGGVKVNFSSASLDGDEVTANAMFHVCP
jgi:methionyl-tRNA formyltransferase